MAFNFKDLNFDLIRITSEAFQADTEGLTAQHAKANEQKGLFTVMPANKWIEQAKNRPTPQMFGSVMIQCRKHFRREYRYNACKAGTKEAIIEMTLNSSGVRDTGRVLKISKYTVYSVLKKR
jgi:hypothetical protein